MMKILILAFIFFWFCKTICSSYTIGIWLTTFTNPGERLLNGQHCDRGEHYACDNKFRICLDFPNGTRDNYDQCRANVPFEMYLGNTIWLDVDKPWQGNISMKVLVLDEDPGHLDQLVDKASRIIKMTVYQNQAEAEASATRQDGGYHSVTMNGSHTSLGLWLKIYCNANWIGPHCDCNKTHPKYHCHTDGEKSCNLPWYGTECNVQCLQASGHQYYRCLQNGTKDCHKDYYGENCDKYCKARDDQRGHYTCAEDGSRICNKNWCSVNSYCNVPCGKSPTPRNTRKLKKTTPKTTTGTAPLTTPGITTRITSEEMEAKMTGKEYLIPIIGGAVGLVLLVTIVIVVCCCKRKHRHQVAQREAIPIQEISMGQNAGTFVTPLYEDTFVNKPAGTAIEVSALSDKKSKKQESTETSNDVYAVPHKTRKNQKYLEHEEVSDDMLVIDNELYDSAAQVQQTRPSNSDAATIMTGRALTQENGLDEMFDGIMLDIDKELHGSASV